MKGAIASLLGASTLLAACGSEQATQQQAAIQPAGSATSGAAIDRPVALGLSGPQLLDAELVNVSGIELGDVQAIVRGASGAVESLLVEVEDSEPDHFVHLPLDGLSAVQDGDDWNIRAPQTREDLLAMPAVPR